MSYWKKCLSTGDYQFVATGDPAPGDIVVPWWEVELARKDKRIAEMEKRIAELDDRLAAANKTIAVQEAQVAVAKEFIKYRRHEESNSLFIGYPKWYS